MQPDQAAEAVYVAFEGFQNREPALAGLLIGDEFLQYVFNCTFQPAAAEQI